jgi:hypothetical protein
VVVSIRHLKTKERLKTGIVEARLIEKRVKCRKVPVKRLQVAGFVVMD